MDTLPARPKQINLYILNEFELNQRVYQVTENLLYFLLLGAIESIVIEKA